MNIEQKVEIKGVAELVKAGAKVHKNGSVTVDKSSWELIMTILKRVKLEVK